MYAIRSYYVTANTVTLSWGASSDNVGVTGYNVYNGNTLVGSVSGSTLSYPVTGLTPDTSYTFNVKAVDAAGNQSSASSVTVKTGQAVADKEAPTAPGNLHVMGTPTASSVDLMWSARITSYNVCYTKLLRQFFIPACINYDHYGPFRAWRRHLYE